MARSEADIIAAESGGNPYIGWGDVDLSKKPLDKYGFPIWEGRMGPEGISHAAGIYQFEPATWREGAQALGVTDFSPESQKKVFDWTYAKYGDAPWKASGGGKTSPEGYYGGAQHITVQPHEDGLITSLLDGIMARVTGKGQQDAQAKEPDLLSQIVQQQAQVSPVERAQPQHPPEQYIEPPAPVPPAADIVSTQKPLEAMPAQGSSAGEKVPATPVPPIPTPSPAAAGAPQANPGRQLLDSIFSGMQLSPMTGPLTSVGRSMTAPPEVVRQPLPIDRQAQVNPGRKLLDEMLTAGGIVPPPTTDVQQAAAEQRQAQTPPEPLIGVGEGGALTGRIPRMAEATAPFLAGGAPGGAVSSGIRLPGRGGAPPPRVEPTINMPASSVPPATRTPGGASRPLLDLLRNEYPTEEVVRQFREETRAGARPEPTEGGGGGGGGPPKEPPREPPANAPGPDLVPPPGIKATAGKLDDALYTTLKNNEADMVEAKQLVEDIGKQHPEWLTPEFSERHYTEAESRLIDPNRMLSHDVRQAEQAMGPLDDDILRIGKKLKSKGVMEADLLTPEEGYVHRKVIGQDIVGERLDPGIDRDVIGVTGGRNLGKRASGLEQRTQNFVADDGAGNRTWSQKLLGQNVAKPPPGYTRMYSADGRTWTKTRPSGLAKYIDYPTTSRGISPRPEEFQRAKYAPPEKYGDRFILGNREVEARRPTTQEIEANTPRRYIKNRIANTIDNWLRLRRIERNIDLLDEWKPKLEAAGFWSPETNTIPAGRVPVDIPQMRGHAEPWIAHTLNDFYNLQKDDFAGFLAKANRFLIGTMFALPFRHQLNVATHYGVGRGFDWVRHNPQLIRATRAVTEQNQDYIRLLRAGAGLQYANTLNQNFYKVMLEKLFHDQIHDPGWSEGVAKHLGVKIADLVKAEYEWSRKALWKVNDQFLVARIMELEGRGLPTAEAIRRAEQEIPNYRIPAQVINMRPVATALKNPAFIAFGRYTYGKYRAIAETVKNMVGPAIGGEPGRRMEAIGQAVVMAMLGTIGYKVANAGLQAAMKQMGYEGKPMEFVRGGPLGLLEAGMDMGGALLGLDPGERDLAGWMSTLISPAPLTTLAVRAVSPFTSKPLWDQGGDMTHKLIQAGEAAATSIFPGQVAIDALRRGPLAAFGPSFGVKQEFQPPSGRVQKMLRGQARAHGRKDPIEQFIRRQFQ